jgi:AmmeMemoRadiSam system protein A
MLTRQERDALLALARTAIAAAVRRTPPDPLAAPRPLSDASGVFVTIRHQGALRGCLGTLRSRLELAGEVVRCAVDAATADVRFSPVGHHELCGLAIEISVLGPLEAIDPNPDAFTIGIHGLVVEDQARRGLLLPQVALEWGWTAEQFLCHTSAKAGLPADAWRQGARVYRFAAEVFGD